MRKTTAPATRAIPSRPGPQHAPEPANGVIPGAGPTDPLADRPGRSSAESLADGPGRSSAESLAVGPGRSSADPLADGPEQPAAGPLTDRPTQPSVERATLRLREDPGRPGEPPRYAPEWLRLREPADGAARAHELLDPLRIHLADLPRRPGGLVVHDVGCGTGSMGRWLAPLLDGAQHWVLHDHDPYLLHFAAVAAPGSAADGSRVTVETRRGDLGRLTPDALAGAALVTASALLDVLTAEEVGTLAAACASAGCPALLTLSVAGRVDLTPAHPLDAEIADAFNDHQRRTGMLGPDAVTVAAEAFAAHGATVRAHPSPWRLGPGEAALTAQWLRGWVRAAVEQRPELREPADRYLNERLAACTAGELRVVVHHTDLLALCRPTGGAS
ncbi:trans-aconitate methyltransferase [Streptomyces sp. b94]|uniref:trans-aconitate methyltransferase n=1 Tax=Streptomyces sp. b94 TaxID=1827634 RepID=UPI001B38533B|nr:trans-aconitate methyltransferase [Streptomyces sp. b94]MBQ1097443.1 trans-aconitate methyltransferase [Streptomyces sp. b94]